MLCLLFLQNARPAFSPSTSSPNPMLLIYQLPQRSDPRQTNSKASKDTIPTIPTDSSIKTHHTHHTHKPTSSSSEQIYNKYYITETFEPLLIFRENATSALLAPYSPAITKEVNSVPYMTEISESEKEKKKFKGRTHAVAVVITFFLLSSHVTSHLPILLKFSQSALPFYFVSFFSCFESYYHPLFFFYIMW